MTNSLFAAGPRRSGPVPARSGTIGLRQAAIIVNPSKFASPHEMDRFQADIITAFAERGWRAPLWLPTTAEFRGAHEARRAIDSRSDVVLVAGGDGTIRTVAQELAGSGIPMSILPKGTGNLLARNLRIPRGDLDAAVQIACAGPDRRIDLGWIDLDRTGNGEAVVTLAFLVMAGMGFDALTMAGADGWLKSKLGASAYVISGIQASQVPMTPTTVTVDGAVQLAGNARGVTVGNCGSLTGGVALMPDANPADGVLDGVAFLQRSILDWARAAWSVLSRGGPHPLLPRLRGRVIEVFTDSQRPVEVDGDVVGEARRVRFHVQPAALVVRCPN